MTNRFDNPPIPFFARLPSGRIKPGDVFSVRGSTFPGSQRFEVNLIGRDGEEDIYLHFNPRFDQQSFVRNAAIGGGWGDEETDGLFSLQEGFPFHLQIYVREEGFQIEIDFRTVGFFNHRGSYEDVRSFSVKGDVSVQSIEFLIHPSHGCLYVPYNSGEHRYDSYEALTTMSGSSSAFHWRSASGGDVPHGAFPGGYTIYGETLYVARAYHEGDLLPGKLHPSHGGCYVAWGEEEHKKEDYEVLTTAWQMFETVDSKSRSRVDYPTLPFSTRLPPGSLSAGTVVYVKATPYEDDRFEVNFKTGPGDIALHFNARFDSDCVVRNSCVDGGWADEERDGRMPFHVGERFKLKFTVQPDAFYAEVDGRYVCSFPHRAPFEAVSEIEIKGDALDVEKIEFAPPKYIPYISEYSRLISPALPIAVPLPRGRLYRGTTIAIVGIPFGDRFEINLRRDEDIHLHLNPRLEQNAVVRNAAPGGDWQDEERDGGSPFIDGEQFDLTITAKDDAFKIKINGSKFCEFSYRIASEEVDQLQIDGDVVIHSVEFKERMPEQTPALYEAPVPLNQPIVGGLYAGRVVTVHGIPTGDRFNINLLTPEGDHSLHFDVRHNYGDSQCVVRNSAIAGIWDTEETDGPFPFRLDRPFVVAIRADNETYKVSQQISVNGRHFVSFSARVRPISRVDLLTIEGDVHLIMVQTE